MPVNSEDGREHGADSTEMMWPEGWHRQFVDDLTATNRFKTYLVAQGVTVPTSVLKKLAKLSAEFQPAILKFTEQEREAARQARRLWPVFIGSARL